MAIGQKSKQVKNFNSGIKAHVATKHVDKTMKSKNILSLTLYFAIFDLPRPFFVTYFKEVFICGTVLKIVIRDSQIVFWNGFNAKAVTN